MTEPDEAAGIVFFWPYRSSGVCGLGEENARLQRFPAIYLYSFPVAERTILADRSVRGENTSDFLDPCTCVFPTTGSGFLLPRQILRSMIQIANESAPETRITPISSPSAENAATDAPIGQGQRLGLPASRRLVSDLVELGYREPSFPTLRRCDLAELRSAREFCPRRIGWATLFVRAFGLLTQEFPVLNQSYLRYPRPRIYQHHRSVGRISIARTHRGQDWLFFGRIDGPEHRSLVDLQTEIDRYATAPIAEIPLFQLQAKFARVPTLLRRAVWRTYLHCSGRLRDSRVGTFGVTSVGRTGCLSHHPPRLQTSVLTYGPLEANGRCEVILTYDHRLMDGLLIGQALGRLEDILVDQMVEELHAIEPQRSY